MDRTSDLGNCNFCKTILMIVIVLYHSGVFWDNTWTAIAPQPYHLLIDFNVWLASFSIYGFTLVSGYIYCHLRYERGGYDTPRRFLNKKVRRILIPFLAFSILWAAPVDSLILDYDDRAMVLSYALGCSPCQLWFLLMLFWVFVFAYPLSDYFMRRGLGSWPVILAIFLCGQILHANFLPYFQICAGMEFLLIFWIGFMLRRSGKTFTTRNLLIWGIAALILNLAFLYCTKYFRGDSLSDYVIFKSLMWTSAIFGSVMSFMLLVAAGRLIHWEKCPLFLSLSRSSYSIYLIHHQIIYVLLVAFSWTLDPILATLCVFIITMATSWGLSALLGMSSLGRIATGDHVYAGKQKRRSQGTEPLSRRKYLSMKNYFLEASRR